jgi:hypothetical protein
MDVFIQVSFSLMEKKKQCSLFYWSNNIIPCKYFISVVIHLCDETEGGNDRVTWNAD